jgi:hypothetical protein
MGIVGQHPETGVRVDVERTDAGPPWSYRGEAVTPDDRFALEARIEADGGVAIELDGRAPAGLGQRIRLLLRAAWKHAHEDGTPPPRRIVRWRADR